MSGTYTYSLLKLPEAVDVIERSDGLSFPYDPANSNLAAYQAWVNAGNKPASLMPSSAVLNALALLAAGLAVTSTATPALNGTYMVSGVAGEGLQAEYNAILQNAVLAQNETFADGTTSLNWPDKTGTGHTFTIAQFKTLISAVSLFVSQCAQYASGLTATLPAATATIP